MNITPLNITNKKHKHTPDLGELVEQLFGVVQIDLRVVHLTQFPSIALVVR